MNTGHTTLSELDAEIWSALATLGEDDSERGLDWRQLLNLLNGKAAQVMQTLAAEREKVRVLREDLAYAINFMGDTLADDTFKKGFVRRQADRFRQTLAATEPGKTDD